jgi:hypothetical protein
MGLVITLELLMVRNSRFVDYTKLLGKSLEPFRSVFVRMKVSENVC